MQLPGANAMVVPVLAGTARAVPLIFLVAGSFLQLPSSRAQEIAAKDDLSGLYMLYASSQLCMRDFKTFAQEHLDNLAFEAKELEETLQLSAEEKQALRDQAESAAAALYSLATPQYQGQQCEQLRGMVDMHLQEKKSLDSF
jgi:hypothetical protein